MGRKIIVVDEAMWKKKFLLYITHQPQKIAVQAANAALEQERLRANGDPKVCPYVEWRFN